MKIFPSTSVVNLHQPSPSDRQTKTNYSCLKVTIFILCTPLCLLVFFGNWISFPPSTPQVHLTSLSLTNFHISPAYENMTANWKARFQIHNPNRVNKLNWKRVFFSISYHGEMLNRILIQPYQQDPKNVTYMDVGFSLVDSSVSSQVIDDIIKDKLYGMTGLVLTMDAEIQRSFGQIHGQWRVRVSCIVVDIGLSKSGESGKLRGGPIGCESTMLQF